MLLKINGEVIQTDDIMHISNIREYPLLENQFKFDIVLKGPYTIVISNKEKPALLALRINIVDMISENKHIPELSL